MSIFEPNKKCNRLMTLYNWQKKDWPIFSYDVKLAETEIKFTLKKVKFFDRFINLLNARQLTVLKRMLGEGAKGFQSGMNARKYAGICKVSKATATWDLQHLAAIGAFEVTGGGRSTSYQVNI